MKTENQMERPKLVIDASDMVLGRIASYVAKQALLGKEVSVVNCENAVVLGRKRSIIDEYKEARQRGGSSLNGPNFPKHSDRLMKRTIRGMLHYNHGRGKEAFKRIRCYIGVPKELESLKQKIPGKQLMTKSMTLKEVSREL
jgi:large subunit ribosomal protein L13